MKQVSTYPVRLKQSYLYKAAFNATAALYRKAISFFIDVCIREWKTVSASPLLQERKTAVEQLTVQTKGRPSVPYDFGKGFYKFPAYIRRAAIAEAIGKVSSYMSNIANWEATDSKTRGKRPGLPVAGHEYPAMYRDGMFIRTGVYTAKIKVFIRNTWDWVTVEFRKSDADYIQRHCGNRKACVPTLQKRGKCWYLDFVFEEKIDLSDTDIDKDLILAVDLGINNACTCSVMHRSGAVFGREFLRLPKENDCLRHAVGRIRKAQMHGAKHMPRLWAAAMGINDDIAAKTAGFIIRTAVKYNVSVIVMEHLDASGKKRGSKKQRLHLWKSQYVQAMVTFKAHQNRIRVSRVCAWNTSRLAFDGSGKVCRGRESWRTGGNYSICEFQNGKLYNCDLNAAYNIGARYYVRELTKSLPVTAKQWLEAKVPSAMKRSTCTLSTLISLNAVLAA